MISSFVVGAGKRKMCVVRCVLGLLQVPRSCMCVHVSHSDSLLTQIWVSALAEFVFTINVTLVTDTTSNCPPSGWGAGDKISEAPHPYPFGFGRSTVFMWMDTLKSCC